MNTRYLKGIDIHTRLDLAQKVVHTILTVDMGIHSSRNQDIEVVCTGTNYTHIDTGMGPSSAEVHSHAFVDTHIHTYRDLVHEEKGMVLSDRDTCKAVD